MVRKDRRSAGQIRCPRGHEWQNPGRGPSPLPRAVARPNPHEDRVQLQFACAQWHLEAWYFADNQGLRGYLERDLGSVDASKPDEIQNPKQHLKQLLRERAYTAVVSQEIARRLDPQTIDQRNPSFHGFVEAVRNGQLTPPAEAGRERVGQ